MSRFLPKIFLDLSSFWVGAILVAVLFALFLRFRKQLKAFFSRTFRKFIDFRESLSVSTDADYIQVLFKFTQGLHLGSNFFPLGSIYVPVGCVAPPPEFFPEKTSVDSSLIRQTLGYDPMLPELPAEYFSPRFSLTEAVRTQVNICLVGLPGTGKTAAIAACMATLVKNRHLEDQPYRKIPFYIKAHHLLAQFPNSDILGILLRSIQANTVFQTIPNFPKYLTGAINSNRAVVFLDDLDLLTIGDLNRCVNFIMALRSSLPDLQIIATASPACLGSFPRSDLEFISVATWGDQEKYTFLEKLSSSWPNQPASGEHRIRDNQSVRQAMLVVSDRFSTPLEFTLKALAAFAGDLTGPDAANAISAFILRELGGQEDLSEALELLALYLLQSRQSAFSKKALNAWMADVFSRQAIRKPDHKFPPFSVVIQAGLDSGILQNAGREEYYFSTPTIAGYLAARGLDYFPPAAILDILDSPDWSVMHEAMRFFAAFNDIKPYLELMRSDQTVLRYKMLRSSLWLSCISSNSQEETSLLKSITREISDTPLFMTKLRLVCSLARSSNPAVKSIFQHLQKSPSLNTRRAAALGSGLIRDLTAVPQLITQLNDDFPSNTAACYALGRIGSPRSLEAIAEALLHGTELLRRAAAESLAQNRSEGHPALREGATRDDLLVRYAVVHGLALIAEDWSLEILDKMRIDENEWVVRDLAQQAYETLVQGSPYLPQQSSPALKAPWLLTFAADEDLPEPTPENALEYLLKALEDGSDDQKQNALAYLARWGNADVIPYLLKAAEENGPAVAQLAELVIWYLAPQRYQTKR